MNLVNPVVDRQMDRRNFLRTLGIGAATAGAVKFGFGTDVVEAGEKPSPFAAVKNSKTPEPSITDLNKPLGLKMTTDEIESADLSSADRVIKFALENDFIKSDSKQLRDRFEQITASIPEYVGNGGSIEDYPPGLIYKNIARIVNDGDMTMREAKIFANYHDENRPHFVYGIVESIHEAHKSPLHLNDGRVITAKKMVSDCLQLMIRRKPELFQIVKN